MSKELNRGDFEEKLKIMNELTTEGVLIWTNLLFEVLFENLPDHVIEILMEKHFEKISKIGKEEPGESE